MTARQPMLALVPDEPSEEDELRALLRAKEKVRGSQRFIRLTRNPALLPPERFEPTVKRDGDIII